MKLTPERWQEVKAILGDAIELPSDERPEFLNNRCNGDLALRREVEVLLAAENDDSDLLELDGADLVFDCMPDMIGKTIGHYRIVAELGSGGMGTVFLAERADDEFDQSVAVKLIKRGMDSDAILKRFFNERQILASLDHPNIAHLIDGGTTDDKLPFFVMEYVEGTPINEYCDSQELGVEQRLDLFREVCAAVSFAHQKLIIHRDLKPVNILITKDGKAKLLDFGIAKIVRIKNPNETSTDMFAFTPDYASPEQVRGESLSTSTDIYSLGVILYELLTGSRPFRFEGRNLGEVISTATNTNPVRPSVARQGNLNELRARPVVEPRSLRGDLDNIVLKALNKEPDRRYSSVEQFSEDIRRHLKGLPVLARKDTLRYRAEKFTRRNPLVVGSVFVAFLILLGGILATGYQARKANIERARAEARFNDVRVLANSFMFEINEAIAESPVKARELLVERAIEYLDKLSAESETNLDLKSELAAAYEKIGEVQSEIFRPFAGKTHEALLSQQKALKLREEILAIQDSSPHAIAVATSHQKLGNVLMTSGKIDEARESYQRSVRIFVQESEKAPGSTEIRRSLARSYSMLGQAIVRSGSLSEALENYDQSLQIFQTLSDQTPEDARARRSIGIVLSYIGFVLMEMGRTDEAVEHYGRWLEIEKQLVAMDPTNVEFRHDLSGSYVWYGVVLSEQGRIAEARESFDLGIRHQQEILAADKENLGEAYSLADCYLEFGKAMARNKLADVAVANLEKALSRYRQIWQKDQKNLMTRHRIANAQRFLADAQNEKGDTEAASENYEQAFLVFKEITEFDPANVDWQQDLAMAYVRRGEISLGRGNETAALSNFREALPIFEKLAANSPDNTKRRKELDAIRALIARSST